MKLSEYEQLKIGDIVSPNRGPNKGHKAVVVGPVWDVTDMDGYREIIVSANFIDPKLSTKPIDRDDLSDLFISYKALTKES